MIADIFCAVNRLWTRGESNPGDVSVNFSLATGPGPQPLQYSKGLVMGS